MCVLNKFNKVLIVNNNILNMPDSISTPKEETDHQQSQQSLHSEIKVGNHVNVREFIDSPDYKGNVNSFASTEKSKKIDSDQDYEVVPHYHAVNQNTFYV